MYETIMLPVDGSERSERAEDFALERAERYGGTVHPIHVIDTRLPSEPALSTRELVSDEAEDAANRMLAEIEKRATDRHLVVTCRTCHGTLHDEVLDYAQEATRMSS